jgi:hypothetical protein
MHRNVAIPSKSWPRPSTNDKVAKNPNLCVCECTAPFRYRHRISVWQNSVALIGSHRLWGVLRLARGSGAVPECPLVKTGLFIGWMCRTELEHEKGGLHSNSTRDTFEWSQEDALNSAGKKFETTGVTEKKCVRTLFNNVFRPSCPEWQNQVRSMVLTGMHNKSYPVMRFDKRRQYSLFSSQISYKQKHHSRWPVVLLNCSEE